MTFELLLNVLYIIIGVTMVLWGADRLTDGASSLARRMRIPEMIIGLTIVAAGTSAPELFVSVASALKGAPDLAVGNVVGSNIMNTLLIVGVTAMVAPMAIAPATVRKDIPFTVGASLLLIVLCLDAFGSLVLAGNTISRLDGFILLAAFAAFMTYTLRLARKSGGEMAPVTDIAQASAAAAPAPWVSLGWVAIGLACLLRRRSLVRGSSAERQRQHHWPYHRCWRHVAA